jgi:signal transduction histidine kinase
MVTTDFGDLFAARLRSEHQALAMRWFERLVEVVPVSAPEVFPTDSLLDHIPALIREIGEYLRRPTGEAIASNTAILAKAAELGALRHSQQASLHQVLREYQILGSVLITFLVEELERSSASPPPAEAVQLVSRLHQAVDVLSQATVEAFVGLYTRTIAEQAERLDQFTRMAVHEWRQPLDTLTIAVSLIRVGELQPDRLERTLGIVDRNVRHLGDLTRKLEAIVRIRSGSGSDNPVVQAVGIATVAQEAARQLSEMAEARGVEVRVLDTLPTLTVDVGRLELTFVNLLSNAIKYADLRKSERFVEVFGESATDGFAKIHVRDNGVGIPAEALGTIFKRFTRAHTDRAGLEDVGGIGLGLSIVEDCVRSMGGHIGVHSLEGQGTTFTVSLPDAR